MKDEPQRPGRIWAQLVKWEALLRREVPTKYPVEIRLRTGLREAPIHCLGICDLVIDLRRKRRVFLIELDAGLTEQTALDYLIHEYAHAASWDQEKKAHGPKWGAAQAKCYRVCVEGERKRRKAA